MVSSTLDWPLPELQHLVTAVPRAAKTSVHLNLEAHGALPSQLSIPARKTVPTGTVECSGCPFPMLGLLFIIPWLITTVLAVNRATQKGLFEPDLSFQLIWGLIIVAGYQMFNPCVKVI